MNSNLSRDNIRCFSQERRIWRRRLLQHLRWEGWLERAWEVKFEGGRRCTGLQRSSRERDEGLERLALILLVRTVYPFTFIPIFLDFLCFETLLCTSFSSPCELLLIRVTVTPRKRYNVVGKVSDLPAAVANL